MVRRGFTIVELLVVIVVMGILLILGVANLRGSQAQARDKQREANAQVIATNLEAFYTDGGPSGSIGRYPSIAIIGSETNYLVDLDTKVLTDPSAAAGSDSLVAASSGAGQSTTTITPTPSSSNLKYVYQPLQSDGSQCTTEVQSCRKFNLYYYQESTSTVVMITSRNQ